MCKLHKESKGLSTDVNECCAQPLSALVGILRASVPSTHARDVRRVFLNFLLHDCTTTWPLLSFTNKRRTNDTNSHVISKLIKLSVVH